MNLVDAQILVSEVDPDEFSLRAVTEQARREDQSDDVAHNNHFQHSADLEMKIALVESVSCFRSHRSTVNCVFRRTKFFDLSVLTS